jgi:hypothetical protein
MQVPNPSTWNEQDVREIVLRPLLHNLGYAKDTKNDIITGYHLKHPWAKFGRKEIPVKAFADYILDVEGKKWVLEAKPPVPITDDDVDQSYSYAAHYEVGGLYFAICNGLELRIYITQKYRHGISPNKTFTFDEIQKETNGSFRMISAILSPNSICREYPNPPIIEDALPLSQTLRSSAKVIKGQIIFSTSNPLLRMLDGLTTTILSGLVERIDSGKLSATIETCVPNAKLQALNKRLGLEKMTLIGDSEAISTDNEFPTILKSDTHVRIPKGTIMPAERGDFALPFDLESTVITSAAGVLTANVFAGTFSATYLFSKTSLINVALGGHALSLGGTFTVELS